MSADNFYLIRKSNSRYYATMCFASDHENGEEWPPIRKKDGSFDTLDAVLKYLAHPDNYAEYPPVYDFPVRLIDISEEE